MHIAYKYLAEKEKIVIMGFTWNVNWPFSFCFFFLSFVIFFVYFYSFFFVCVCEFFLCYCFNCVLIKKKLSRSKDTEIQAKYNQLAGHVEEDEMLWGYTPTRFEKNRSTAIHVTMVLAYYVIVTVGLGKETTKEGK